MGGWREGKMDASRSGGCVDEDGEYTVEQAIAQGSGYHIR